MTFLVLKKCRDFKQKLLIKTRKFVNCERAKRASGKFLDGFCKKVANVEIGESTVLPTASERQILGDFGET